MQFVAQRQQIDLSYRFAVHQRPSPTGLGHALDLHTAAAPHRHIDVLPAGSHADTHVARAAADSADQQDRLFHFVRRPQFRARNRFDQRHAQPVGAPHDQVPTVGYFATTVLLHTHLGDAELPTAKRQRAVDTHNGRSLKSGGNRTVQVLFAGDVHFVHDVAAQHQALLDGDVEGLGVH